MVRKGKSCRQVARHFGVDHHTVSHWVAKAQDKRLDRVDFSTSERTGRPHNKTADGIEELILQLRKQLKQSDLGDRGAAAIHNELARMQMPELPSIRTIGRVLERRGALDCRRRVRHPSPPKGWYLPDVAAWQQDIDSCDAIEQLRIENGPLIDVLTATSILGNLPGAWPSESGMKAKFVVEKLISHWQDFGLPGYVQFDNGNCFQGPHHHKDVIGRVTRLALSLNVTPVFAVPGEYGFQASIENFNGRWQRRVWSRFEHQSIADVILRSDKFTAALRKRNKLAIDHAPPRSPFPSGWTLDLKQHPCGKIIYLRRCSDRGDVSFLGHTFHVAGHWTGRLVRCEVLLDEDRIDFYALRRREPTQQHLITQTFHKVKKRVFTE